MAGASKKSSKRQLLAAEEVFLGSPPDVQELVGALENVVANSNNFLAKVQWWRESWDRYGEELHSGVIHNDTLRELLTAQDSVISILKAKGFDISKLKEMPLAGKRLGVVAPQGRIVEIRDIDARGEMQKYVDRALILSSELPWILSKVWFSTAGLADVSNECILDWREILLEEEAKKEEHITSLRSDKAHLERQILSENEQIYRMLTKKEREEVYGWEDKIEVIENPYLYDVSLLVSRGFLWEDILECFSSGDKITGDNKYFSLTASKHYSTKYGADAYESMKRIRAAGSKKKITEKELKEVFDFEEDAAGFEERKIEVSQYLHSHDFRKYDVRVSPKYRAIARINTAIQSDHKELEGIQSQLSAINTYLERQGFRETPKTPPTSSGHF